MKKVFLLLSVIFLCSTLGWGQSQKWNLTPTMTAELKPSNYDKDVFYLWIRTAATSEAMPDYNLYSPAPWSSVRNRINIIHIEDNVTSIGSYVFENCSNLSQISISKSVASIGDGAFQGCSGLRIVSVEIEKPLSLSNNVFGSVNLSNVTLYVPKGAVKRYKSADVWKNFKRIEKDVDNLDIGVGDQLELKNFPIVKEVIAFFHDKVGERAMVWTVLILSVVLFFMRISKKKDEPRQGAVYWISTVLFLTACTLEILYFISVDDFMWICTPGRVGWLWTIINFFLFGGIVYNQILYLFDVMYDVLANGNAGCDLRLGYYSWIGGLVGVLLCGFLFKAGIPVVLIIIGILQIIQAVLIFKSYGKNIKGAFWGIFAYLLGSIGTLAIFVAFLSILILVVVGLAVLWLVLKLTDASKSSSSSSSSNPNSNQYCGTCKHYPGNGYNCGRKYQAGSYDGSMVSENSEACFYWELKT